MGGDILGPGDSDWGLMLGITIGRRGTAAEFRTGVDPALIVVLGARSLRAGDRLWTLVFTKPSVTPLLSSLEPHPDAALG